LSMFFVPSALKSKASLNQLQPDGVSLTVTAFVPILSQGLRTPVFVLT